MADVKPFKVGVKLFKMRMACQPVVVEKLFQEEVDEESSNFAWYHIEVPEAQKKVGAAGKQMMDLYPALLVESNSKA